MRSTLLVMATGLGKTVVMANVAKRWPTGRIMLIAHREELIFQARAQFAAWTDEEIDVEMGEYEADQCAVKDNARIVLSSVQTLNTKRKGQYRMEKFRPDEFGLLFTDEAHHSTADSYRRVYEHFGKNPRMCHLGVTATPDRGDQQALGQIFDSVAATYDLEWAIANGWLVDLHQKFVRIDGFDLSNVKTRMGDLKQDELAEIMEQERICHEVAFPVVDVCGDDRQAIIFTVSVKQAHSIAAIINRHTHGQAFAIDGTTPKDERRALIAEFGRKHKRFLVNCQVATEGFDCPTADVCAIARPTKVRSLYAQMVGRITRPLPGVVDELFTPDERKEAILASGKPNGLVLDYIGQSSRHKLCNTGDILGGNYHLEELEDVANRMARSGNHGSIREEIVRMREELARLKEEKRLRDRLEREEEQRRLALIPAVQYSMFPVDMWRAIGGVSNRLAPWKASKPATDKQQAALMRFGVAQDVAASMNMAKASNVLDKLVSRSRQGLCTYKQAILLQKNGIDGAEMTFEEASRHITEISKGWRKR